MSKELIETAILHADTSHPLWRGALRDSIFAAFAHPENAEHPDAWIDATADHLVKSYGAGGGLKSAPHIVARQIAKAALLMGIEKGKGA